MKACMRVAERSNHRLLLPNNFTMINDKSIFCFSLPASHCSYTVTIVSVHTSLDMIYAQKVVLPKHFVQRTEFDKQCQLNVPIVRHR